MHIDRDYLNGHKLRIYWRWYLDYSSAFYTLANVYVVNNVNNRKLEASGEFSTYSDAEHPVTDFTYTTTCSLSETCNGGWINWRTDTSSVLNLNGWNSKVTIMIKSVDPWIANTVGLEIDYLQILDSNNNVVRQYDFTDKVCMEKTGGYYDYGQLRNPTSLLYGTRDYAGMDAPAG